MDISGVGIWSTGLRASTATDPGPIPEAAAELEELGYTAIWIPGGAGNQDFLDAEVVLGATGRIVHATGILNIWMHETTEVAAKHAALTAAYPDRFLLGLGVSHAPLVDAGSAGRYRKPYAAMVDFLDGLDAAPTPVPVTERALAALGPRMLALSAERSLGAHPYLVTPEHTAIARETLGAGPLLAPELKVVLETEPATARAIARDHLSRYLVLPNYVNNLLRLGYTEDDVAGEGSDALVDRVFAWGDEAAVIARLKEHQAAGADHVCLQVFTSDNSVLPREQWRRVAAAL